MFLTMINQPTPAIRGLTNSIVHAILIPSIGRTRVTAKIILGSRAWKTHRSFEKAILIRHTLELSIGHHLHVPQSVQATHNTLSTQTHRLQCWHTRTVRRRQLLDGAAFNSSRMSTGRATTCSSYHLGLAPGAFPPASGYSALHK
jgi:hypothetical protein